MNGGASERCGRDCADSRFGDFRHSWVRGKEGSQMFCNADRSVSSVRIQKNMQSVM